MNSFLAAGLGLLGNALQVIIPLVGLVLIMVRVRGRARDLGVAGCAVLAAIGALQALWIFLAPQLYRAVGPSGLGVIGLGFAVVSAVGLGLIIAAVCARGASSPGPQPYAPYGRPPV